MPESDLILKPTEVTARFILRAAPGDAAKAGGALGFVLPVRPLSSAEASGAAALWLGPDEWLVLGFDCAPDTLGETVTSALGGAAFSLVDVTHRQLGYELSGRLARQVLTSGCPLDFDLSAWPVGQAARTMFHKCEVVIWRRGPHAFHIEVWRSFAPYVRDLIDEAHKGAFGL